MNTMHDANRRYWNEVAEWWERLEEEGGLWRRCPSEPELAFDGGTLELVREVVGTVSGKDVCVVGSGDNHAAFAFSGMGANVTSVDVSERRLAVASKRARHLGLPITFVHADAADLSPIENAEFDLVFSSNGFFVWISDLQAVFSEIYRILRPGGHYVFYDIHPFLRPWKDQTTPIEVAKPYWQTGPMEDEEGAPLSSTGRLRTSSTPWRVRDSSCGKPWRVPPRTQGSGRTISTYPGLTTAC